MGEITITNPEIYTEKKVDAQGRVYVGTEWKGQRVRIAIEEIDDQ